MLSMFSFEPDLKNRSLEAWSEKKITLEIDSIQGNTVHTLMNAW